MSVDATKLRRDLGLTSGQFARLVGASLSTVSRWEHGHAEPDGALASICTLALAEARILATPP